MPVSDRWFTLARGGSLLLLALSGAACYTWRAETVAPETFLATSQPSAIRVTRTDGSSTTLHHPVLQVDSLFGTRSPDARSEPIQIAIVDVRQFATHHFSAGRTVGLGLGFSLVVLLLLSTMCGYGTACGA